jgi:hypothetical protein
MRLETNVFNCEIPVEYDCWFESDSDLITNAVFFSNRYGLQGLFEVLSSQNAAELPFLCEEAFEAEIVSLSGYVDDLDDEFPNEMVTLFTDESGEHAYRHFLAFHGEFAAHLILTSGFLEPDHLEARKLVESFQFDSQIKAGKNLERVNFKVSESLQIDKIGSSRYILTRS